MKMKVPFWVGLGFLLQSAIIQPPWQWFCTLSSSTFVVAFQVSTPTTRTRIGEPIYNHQRQKSYTLLFSSRDSQTETFTKTTSTKVISTTKTENTTFTKSDTKTQQIKSMTKNTIEKINEPTADEYQQGFNIIAFITILFSSNSPVIHSAFVSVSSPPPVLLLNALASTIALLGIFIGGPILNTSVPLPCTLEEDISSSSLLSSSSSSSITNLPQECQVQDVSTLNNNSLKAGIELGSWKMLGTTFNLYGLSLTSADHGAFLIQLTTLIVPVVQGIMGIPIPPQIWVAVILALMGVVIFTGGASTLVGMIMMDPNILAMENGSDSLTMTSSALTGDGLCILAAIFYATYDLRLFDWGKKVEPLTLIKKKIAVQSALSLGVLGVFGWEETSNYVQSTMESFTASGGNTNDVWLVLAVALWSGIAINAIAPFLQVGGQQAVGATRAQVIYASQPLWAAILSYFLLEETLGMEGFAGGLLFLIAMFLAATAETPDPDCETERCEV